MSDLSEVPTTSRWSLQLGFWSSALFSAHPLFTKMSCADNLRCCATPCGTSKLVGEPLESTKFTIKFTTKIHSESACADNLRCCATEGQRRSVALQIDKVDDKSDKVRKNSCALPSSIRL